MAAEPYYLSPQLPAALARMDAAESELTALEHDEARPHVEAWLAERATLPHDSYGTQARLSDMD